MSIQDYLNLITSEHRDKPDFVSVVTTNVTPLDQIQKLLTSMIPKFDVDSAVGNQLDIIGQWVGISRNVNIPTAGVYFTWDDTTFDGWDCGTWIPDIVPSAITVLTDESYRVLVKAKIAANHWDGTIEGAYAIWDSIFSTFKIMIQDNHDMTYNFIIVGGIIDSLTLALITNNYIPLRPEGVRVREYLISVDTNPGFAWDIETSLLKGWDEASWLKESTPA